MIDEVSAYACKLGTSLASFDVSNLEFASLSQTRLDDTRDAQVTAVRAYGNVMVVARDHYVPETAGFWNDVDPSDPGDAEVIDFTTRTGSYGDVGLVHLAPDGSIRDDGYVPAPRLVRAISRAADTLRVAGTGPRESAIVTSYEFAGPAQLRLLQTCKIAADSNTLDVAGNLAFAADDWTLSVSAWSPEQGCRKIELPVEKRGALVSSPDDTRAVYLSADAEFDSGPNNLLLQWFDTTRGVDDALLGTRTSEARAFEWTSQESNWVTRAGPDAASWLFVPLRSRDDDEIAFEATQAFGLNGDTLAEYPLIRDRAGAVAVGATEVAAVGRAALEVLDTTGTGFAKRGAAVLETPLRGAVPFDTFIARTKPLPTLWLRDSRRASESAEVELVTMDDRVASTLRVPFYAQLARAGDLLIAMTPKTPAPDPANSSNLEVGSEASRLMLDVIDVSDPEQPTPTGSVEIAWPGSPDCELKGLLCKLTSPVDVISTAHAIVLPEHGSSRVKFRVIDLRTPSAPTVAVVEGSRDVTYKRSVARGNTLYYSFYKTIAEGEQESSRRFVPLTVEYFAGALDLTDPRAPQLGEPRRVPGQILAMSAGNFYASEIAIVRGVRQTSLHRIELSEQGPRVIASRVLGDVTVRSLQPDDQEHLVADILGPDWYTKTVLGDEPPPWGPATRLAVFDATTLDELGQIELERTMVLRSVRGKRAVFQGIETGAGIGVIDLRVPAAPRLETFMWTQRTYKTDTDLPLLLFDGHRVTAADSGRMLSFEVGRAVGSKDE